MSNAKTLLKAGSIHQLIKRGSADNKLIAIH